MRAAVHERDQTHHAPEHAVRHVLLGRRVEEDDDAALADAGERGSDRSDPERAGEREQAVGRQVQHPRRQARERLAPNGAVGENDAGGDGAGGVRAAARSEKLPAPRPSVSRTN